VESTFYFQFSPATCMLFSVKIRIHRAPSAIRNRCKSLPLPPADK
jgi:hypothetical protein